MQVIDGNAIAADILSKLRAKIIKQNLRPHLGVVLVGDNQASKTYVRKKQEAAESIGVKFSLYRFPENIQQGELEEEIDLIQQEDLSGIIVQLPLPKDLDKKTVLNKLTADIDVDFLTWVSLGKLLIGETSMLPPSPAAVMEILSRYKVDLRGKHVVLVGSGDLIGKPLKNILVKLPLTLTVCNKDTKNLPKFTKMADIIITGVGKPGMIKGNMVKSGVVAIDAGVSFEGKKQKGDLDFASVSKKASLITPTPGGVGPITVAKLLENTVINAARKVNWKQVR
ncbi:MAG: bifunctional 5,10-methylenetetrahydrofolate dehydrogenase/5,10-methenyltetrahydrofolate cyclohydrolase [Candidatus Doudnabacteria bacterium]|nr:bifunctional 5,10-methylenetetrahydrofolate dehydrogenase/5,10-methenyltetrahydrofolate cyclohydrolase [Candidatus Doudnabacteria bacterium]